MSIKSFFPKNLSDDLKTFRTFEIILALICVTIPVVLRLADPDRTSFRDSISDYVNMKHSYLFGMLLCIPAMLFMFNGAVYFRKGPALLADPNGKWYNLILGASLLGVICFNCNDHNTIHTAFACIFFFGNALVFAVFNKIHRAIGIALSALSAILLVLGKIYISILWGEWLSLIIIGIHFILMTDRVVTLSMNAELGNRDQ